MRIVRRSARLEAKFEQDGQHDATAKAKIESPAATRTTVPPSFQEHENDVSMNAEHPIRTSRKRKAKVLATDDSEHLERVKSCPWKIGAHVSSAGGVENAVLNAAAIGANAFALFLKSQRKWHGPPLSEDSISLFKTRMEQYDYTPSVVLPHGSYLVNLGNPDPAKREKSYECFLDDLRRCEQLGLEMYNFHPGSTLGSISTDECIAHIANSINRAHKETNSVTIVIENMAGSGNVIGSDFKELGSIIGRVEDRSRVGVCLDTCHMFAAGHDIRTKDGWDSMLSQFDEKVGLKYLRGMHINDSKMDLNSRRDRHENIGLGFLGIRTFSHLLSDPRVQGIPLILETQSFEKPKDVWGKEIQVLQRLVAINADKHGALTDIEEKEMSDSIREVVKLVGGSRTNKKSRSSTTTANGKASGRRKKKGVKESEGEDEPAESDED